VEGLRMYTAIRDYKLNVESLDDETLKRVNDEWVPILQSTDGFIEYHIIDSGDSRLTTVGVFETEAGAEESRQRASQWVNDNLSHLVAEPPHVMTGEVILSARS
jgi:hypothetical protein